MPGGVEGLRPVKISCRLSAVGKQEDKQPRLVVLRSSGSYYSWGTFCQWELGTGGRWAPVLTISLSTGHTHTHTPSAAGSDLSSRSTRRMIAMPIAVSMRIDDS